MSNLLPCPFCGGEPKVTERPSSHDERAYFCAVACYCGGYSACAHKMATEPTEDEARSSAFAAWNRRAQPAPVTEALVSALEGMLAIHTEPVGFVGKWGCVLDEAIAVQQIKIDQRIAAARAAIDAAIAQRGEGGE